MKQLIKPTVSFILTMMFMGMEVYVWGEVSNPLVGIILYFSILTNIVVVEKLK